MSDRSFLEFLVTWNDLRGKSALVTGASSGLGRHFAQVLASHGVRVTLAARNVASLRDECTRIRATGGDAQYVEMDVTLKDSVEYAYGLHDGHFDIVVNNAGINRSGPAIDLSEAEWDDVLDTNLKGVFTVSQVAARRWLADKKGGCIVNIGSILGIRVASQVASYTASKAAVVQLTKALALEWARHGIRVNTICPGYFETELNKTFLTTEAGMALVKRIPQRRLGQIHELDAPFLLLCSDAGSYMTGSVIAVDGGHLVSGL